MAAINRVSARAAEPADDGSRPLNEADMMRLTEATGGKIPGVS